MHRQAVPFKQCHGQWHRATGTPEQLPAAKPCHAHPAPLGRFSRPPSCWTCTVLHCTASSRAPGFLRCRLEPPRTPAPRMCVILHNSSRSCTGRHCSMWHAGGSQCLTGALRAAVRVVWRLTAAPRILGGSNESRQKVEPFQPKSERAESVNCGIEGGTRTGGQP